MRKLGRPQAPPPIKAGSEFPAAQTAGLPALRDGSRPCAPVTSCTWDTSLTGPKPGLRGRESDTKLHPRAPSRGPAASWLWDAMRPPRPGSPLVLTQWGWSLFLTDLRGIQRSVASAAQSSEQSRGVWRRLTLQGRSTGHGGLGAKGWSACRGGWTLHSGNRSQQRVCNEGRCAPRGAGGDGVQLHIIPVAEASRATCSVYRRE